jgi:hypothetical protein
VTAEKNEARIAFDSSNLSFFSVTRSMGLGQQDTSKKYQQKSSKISPCMAME